MENTWEKNARVSLAVVASVVGEKINNWQVYVSCRRMMLARREGLYRNAFTVLKGRLSSAELESCKRRYLALTKKTDVEKMAHDAMKQGVL
jgi:hypothetical protein